MIGTPGYMAPEMALSATVDGRADLYSLGCVAYYLLTGRQVFEGETVMQVFAQHLQAAPVSPSQRAPSGVPPDLDQLVLDCLAKKPEDRPRSAAELERRLAAVDVEPWTDVRRPAMVGGDETVFRRSRTETPKRVTGGRHRGRASPDQPSCRELRLCTSICL